MKQELVNNFNFKFMRSFYSNSDFSRSVFMSHDPIFLFEFRFFLMSDDPINLRIRYLETHIHVCYQVHFFNVHLCQQIFAFKLTPSKAYAHTLAQFSPSYLADSDSAICCNVPALLFWLWKFDSWTLSNLRSAFKCRCGMHSYITLV